MGFGAIALGAGAAIGAVGNLISSHKSAQAAGEAAAARERLSQQQRTEGLAYLSRVGGQEISAAQSPQELASLGKALSQTDMQLQRQETLLNSVDPALMEAGKQALSLLRGEKAPSQAPMDAQRASQRSSLVQRLREQFGPGAESSSIGQKALQQFDLDSNVQSSQNQQTTLSQLLGLSSQTHAQASQGQQFGIGNLGNIAGAYGNIAARTAGAYGDVGNRYSNFSTGANANAFNAAGSASTKNVLQGQADAQLWGNITNGLVSGIGTGLGQSGAFQNMFGSPAPKATA